MYIIKIHLGVFAATKRSLLGGSGAAVGPVLAFGRPNGPGPLLTWAGRPVFPAVADEGRCCPVLDTRFSSALLAMLLLAAADEGDAPVLSSAQLAEKMGTNPSLVRKLLLPLTQAELVIGTKGRAGGARLARPAAEITLAEVHAFSTGDKPLWNCRSGNEHDCFVTANAQAYFAELTG